MTARSGSKSIQHKNIKLLNGIPLLSYRITSALKTTFSHDLWISTDSKEYAEIANKFGAETPFIRPEELSLDDSSSSDVILHAMAHANKIGKVYDYVGMLEPTSPFITSDQLDSALASLDENKKALAVVAVVESRPHKIFIQENSEFLVELAENFKGLKNLGRQAFKKEITPSGGFYISRWEAFLENESFYTSRTLSYEVDEISGLEIDEPRDWDFAEFIIQNKGINEIK
ncbi:acylneuraminate cytidylyltransferase family protein [Schleiferiaceae bacterium]|nr:acylneuraminate cytidylyltransferase family protein [Schleiferiaceae bacterium]